ncbi:MAG: Fic family protein [Gammaproteobacteria bacterium]|nr:Fic family protein [Gammaproteobacteria bacterium]
MNEWPTENPPYAITPQIVDLVVRIGEAIGRLDEYAIRRDLRLRKINRIRTIQGSLAIEGNMLSEDEITAILEGKPVIAPPREVQEVRNALKTYDEFQNWNSASIDDLLTAHEILMTGLLDTPGQFRHINVGVVGGDEVRHAAPSARRVPMLMDNLLTWLSQTEEHPLIASSVFHYEFEFIHPFEDGNGRMGRLWQSLILAQWKPLFAYVPVESLIYARQGSYYEAIQQSTAEGASTIFIVYMLESILDAVVSTPQETLQVTPQVKRLLSVLKSEMSLRQMMDALELQDRKSFRQRYLRPALDCGYVEMTQPESPTARNQRYRSTARGQAVRQSNS